MLRGVLAALVGMQAGGVLAAEGWQDRFEREIRPLLHNQCGDCHGEKLQSAGIDFRDAGTVIGTAVVSGDESSPLIRAVRYESALKMPPGSKLPQAEIEKLVAWVRAGAIWPGYEPVGSSPAEEAERSVESSHWSFQPIVDPPVPDSGSSTWVRNDIDRFVLARLKEAGLQPSEEADPLTLVRRVHFDLLGLPPDPTAVEGHQTWSDEQAYSELVDGLLDSPHYGERWGRHWLDVARYADSTGVDEDHPFGDSWRYRDYVVQAFNADLRFDQFVRDQIAGDLLPAPEGEPVNRPGIVATGFLALGPMALAQRDPIQKKYDVVDEQIDTTTKAFLGLTVACARCHDHKFDPILTSDYYALAGIFASTRTFDDWTRNGSRYYRHPLVEPSVYDAYREHADELAALERVRGVSRIVALRRYLLDHEVPRVKNYMLAAAGVQDGGDLDPERVDWYREYLRPQPARRPHIQPWHDAAGSEASIAARYATEVAETVREQIATLQEWRDAAMDAVDTRGDDAEPPEFPRLQPKSLLYRDLVDDDGPFDMDPDDVEDSFAAEDREFLAALAERIKGIEQQIPEEPPMANSVTEDVSVQQRIFRRGQHKNPGAAVSKRFPLVLAGNDQPAVESVSGRLELAHWLSSSGNPLTARVIVNRVWLWHFGEGLVRTPSNFGLRGEAPTHPALLDWLASRFVEGGWSVKNLHRLIMDSATYRMRSNITPEAAEKDPENRLWSRFERRRLTIEELRDSYLQISSRLDPAVGGNTDLGSRKLVEFDRNNRRIDPDDYTRRSVYLPLMRNKLPNLLGLFDFGDAATANAKRSVTNVAPQALYLMNSEFAHGAAAGLADTLVGSPEDRIDNAYRRVLGRPPTKEERRDAVQYVQARSDQAAAWTSLCKTLLASNEFHYIE